MNDVPNATPGPTIDVITNLLNTTKQTICKWNETSNLTVLDDKACERIVRECDRFRARLKRIAADQEYKALVTRKQPTTA